MDIMGSLTDPAARNEGEEAPYDPLLSAEASQAHLEPSEASHTPRPLMPDVTAATTGRHPAASRGQVPRRLEAAEAGPPEVHVHIGRIEVTSVPEPQPQRQEAPRRRGKPAMSLEDYLDRRKAGG
jgi:hypothetical protein